MIILKSENISMCPIVPFSKTSKDYTQLAKTIKRNKVMHFGVYSQKSVEMVDRFVLYGAQ